MPDCDVAVVGTSPTGLALTLDLARRGMPVEDHRLVHVVTKTAAVIVQVPTTTPNSGAVARR